MWQRFTERARRVVFFAQEEAGRLGENHVSTEHLLLGMVREPESAGCVVLERMNVNLGKIKAEAERQIPHGSAAEQKDFQLTPRAKRVIDLAYDEARQLENDYIGTEHLLLGTLREGEGLAARILAKLGADLDTAREEVKKLQSEGKAGSERKGKPVVPPEPRKERVVHIPKRGDVRPLRPFDSPEDAVRATSLRGHDLLSIADLSTQDIEQILSTAFLLKSGSISRGQQLTLLEGRTLAMIFEKPSLRTRVTFEVGMTQLGGHGIYLQPSDIKMGQREPVKDVARNLERWCDCIMARVFKHESVTELAEYSSLPVINALSDIEHPCQALADFLTIKEHKGKLDDLKLAFIGDGNNVAHSLMLLAAKLGTHIFVACPEGYEPDPKIVEQSKALAAETGAQIEIVRKAEVAAADADVLYTDVWTSMGQEAENEKRLKDFQGYQINSDLMKLAKDDAIVLHCLPAKRGEEITDEVMESPQSVVFDQAENRLHAQKAVLVLVV